MVSQHEREIHEKADPHRSDSSLTDIILGGQDGLVNILGVVLGVAAASSSTRLVLAAGVAGAVAESVSMAAVAYTSSVAAGDLYKSERAREYRHIELVPNLEREEVRALYRRKGFDGELLDRIVQTITKDPDVWVAVMMAEEHRIMPVSRQRSLRSALVVGVASLIGSFLPIAPFAVFPVRAAVWLSVAVAALTLYVAGAYKARVTVGSPAKSGLELVAIGTTAAAVGYLVGVFFQVTPTL